MIYLGENRYELSNHLSNVLAVVTDRKLQQCNVNGVQYYEAQIVMTSDYYPFGMLMEDTTNWRQDTSYRFGFNTQENDDEIYGEGNSTTAEFWHYDTRLGRRWNLDPVVWHNKSQYVCLSNNPIIRIDPNGDADFINEAGKIVGTDGRKDGKIYILTSQADIKKAKQSYFGTGFKGFVNGLFNRGGNGTIQTKEFTGDVVPIPSDKVRQAIYEAYKASNNPNETDKEGGFHEEGGFWGVDKDGNELVVEAKPGETADPRDDDKAEVNVFDSKDPSEKEAVVSVAGTYHIHPKGKKTTTDMSGNPGSTSSTADVQTDEFTQTPSDQDVSTARSGGNNSGYSIVVGAGNKTVYIHGSASQNQKGKNYRAKIDLYKFIKLKEKQSKTNE